VARDQSQQRPGPGRRPRAGALPGAALKRILLIALAVVAFLAISGLVTQYLSVENTERDADLALIQAQARGDAASMIRQLSGCAADPACVRQVRENVADPRLRRPGAIKILALSSPTAYTLTGATGRTRIAWTVIGTLPVVQCIDVRRTGDVLRGIEVELLSISAPIENEGTC